MKQYDYIFIGGGCAGLSLLTRMIAAGLTQDKTVLLIDKDPKQKNDRTWCFWEDKPGFFEPVVCKQWDRLWFHANDFSRQIETAPYRYKMIRGIDFYRYCLNSIAQRTGIDTLYGNITAMEVSGNILHLTIDDRSHQYESTTIFNSTWKENAVRQQQAIYLLQHFKGWMIETTTPFFKPAEATLMDFRVSQQYGTTFAYVLPISARKALVEYTLFSENTLPDECYNQGLQQYLQQWLHLKDYSITEEEFGIIPMTSATFPWYANGMYHIGTAGGQTKASSGYTFQFIQKQSTAIIHQLRQRGLQPKAPAGAIPKRFRFYDAVLLQALIAKKPSGSEIFTSLFKKNRPADIFRFLDNASSPLIDWRIIHSLPARPFLQAAFKQIVNG